MRGVIGNHRHFKPCDFNVNFINDGSMSVYEKLCYVMEVMKEWNDFLKTFQEELEAKEDSSNITNNRKLSEKGDFTGTWKGENIESILYDIDSNNDAIRFLANQFEDGATGQVIDGGFFDETGINKNYDGGVF